jgi:AraC-like DNA-binding protein
MMEQYDLALPYFKRSLEVQPELPFPVVNIGVCHSLSGRLDEGLMYFNNLSNDNTGFLAKLGGTTITQILTGNITEAKEGISKLETYLETPSAGNAINFLILCHAQLNQIEIALEYINKAIESHFPLVLLLPTEPLAKPLHHNSTFKKYIKGILGKTNQQTLELTESDRKYKKSLFTNEELLRYKNRLNSLMKDDKLYLSPELSLRSLADYMNLPSNHMSQLLNEGFNQNFSDYINSYRLDTFKIKLSLDSAHQLTILALAYDSGFNSKTVFNTFFKKKMGITPKAYWNELNN